jgi:hypothetical protein
MVGWGVSTTERGQIGDHTCVEETNKTMAGIPEGSPNSSVSRPRGWPSVLLLLVANS